MRNLTQLIILISLISFLSGCGPYVGKATLGQGMQTTQPIAGVSVNDRRGISGIELHGVANTQQPHRIETQPSVAEATRNVLSRHLAEMSPEDSVSVTILKNSCMTAHRFHKADVSFEFQAEAQYTVNGRTYTKMLAAGQTPQTMSAGMGLDPNEICPNLFEQALEQVGTQAKDFYSIVKGQ